MPAPDFLKEMQMEDTEKSVGAIIQSGEHRPKVFPIDKIRVSIRA